MTNSSLFFFFNPLSSIFGFHFLSAQLNPTFRTYGGVESAWLVIFCGTRVTVCYQTVLHSLIPKLDVVHGSYEVQTHLPPLVFQSLQALVFERVRCLERLLRAKSVVDEAEYGPRAILCEGQPGVSILHRNVGVRDRGGWNEGCSAMGEFDHQFRLPKHKVTAFGGVKATKGRDGTEAKRAVHDVAVLP